MQSIVASNATPLGAPESGYGLAGFSMFGFRTPTATESAIASILGSWSTGAAPRVIRRAVDPNANAMALRSWLSQALDALKVVSESEDNWDGYGAPRIEVATVMAAMRFLKDVQPFATTAPAVVPTGRGNIRFEWRVSHGALDVEIRPDGVYEASYEDSTSEIEWEGDTRDGVDPSLTDLIADRELLGSVA